MELELTQEQRNLLRSALLASYSDFQELRHLMRQECDDALISIAKGIAIGPGVDALLDWAEQEGRSRCLSEALGKARPGNTKVRLYRQSLTALELPKRNSAMVSVPAHWSPALSGLEAMVEKANPLRVAAAWRAEMGVAESRVCRMESEAGRAVGTGFLVGTDLVLTNCHVYRAFQAQTPVARFGFGEAAATGVASVCKEPPLAFSTEDRLDYALLRLAEPIGQERGWFRPKRHQFGRDQLHLILQHASGGPLQLGIGQVTAVVDLPPRVTYSTNTEPGSSGSPAFTMDWQLVALHHYGVKGVNNVGIPMVAIWEEMAKAGVVPAS